MMNTEVTAGNRLACDTKKYQGRVQILGMPLYWLPITFLSFPPVAFVELSGNIFIGG